MDLSERKAAVFDWMVGQSRVTIVGDMCVHDFEPQLEQVPKVLHLGNNGDPSIVFNTLLEAMEAAMAQDEEMEDSR